MKVLEVNSIQPGTVLAKAVKDMHGMLLLKAKTVLSEKNLLLLKSWGITEVYVDGETEPEPAPNNPTDRELLVRIGHQVAERFNSVEDDEVMAEIKRVAVKVLHRRHVRDEDHSV